MKTALLSIIFFCFSMLYFTKDETVVVTTINEKNFKNFILIEYNADSSDFELITDMLDKSVCMEQLLEISCLKEKPIVKDSRIESIRIKLQN